MKFISGTQYVQKNYVYLYDSGTHKKIHVYGQFKKYLENNNVKYINVAYRPSQNNIVYFIPCFDSDYDKSQKPSKLYFTSNENNMSFSCAALFNELNVPVCNFTIKKDQKKEYKGHSLPYEIFQVDEKRKAIRFDLNDIQTKLEVPQKKSKDNNIEEFKITREHIVTDDLILKTMLKDTIYQIDLGDDRNKYAPDVLIYDDGPKCWMTLLLIDENPIKYVINNYKIFKY